MKCPIRFSERASPSFSRRAQRATSTTGVLGWHLAGTWHDCAIDRAWRRACKGRRQCVVRPHFDPPFFHKPQPDSLGTWWPKSHVTPVARVLRSGLVRCRGHARIIVMHPKMNEMSFNTSKFNYIFVIVRQFSPPKKLVLTTGSHGGRLPEKSVIVANVACVFEVKFTLGAVTVGRCACCNQ